MIHAGAVRLAQPTGSVHPAGRGPTFLAIAEVWRELRKSFLDTYRPERHYMRGPGPKWREKHVAPRATGPDAIVGTMRGATA